MSKDVSVILPVQVADIGMALPYARMASATRSERLWSGQSMGIETHAVFAALAGMGTGLQFGSAVSLMPLRHPSLAALEARSIAALSGREYICGIGPGGRSLQRAALGASYGSPLAATREYATAMRSLLDGTVVSSPGGRWPMNGLMLPPLDAPPVEIGLGVLREKMARLAGEVAEWAITWLTPVEYIDAALTEASAAGADACDRPAPRIASVLHCVLDRPHRDRTAVARMSSERHLAAPHYVDMLERAGITFASPDPNERAEAMLEHGVIASGTAEDIAAEVRRYHDHGVSEVILNVGGVFLADGPGAAARDLNVILDAIGDV
ncbi:LLM class flavin-dependent oxidoreductase [Actinomycetes bacterium M1A6_2h]